MYGSNASAGLDLAGTSDNWFQFNLVSQAGYYCTRGSDIWFHVCVQLYHQGTLHNFDVFSLDFVGQVPDFCVIHHQVPPSKNFFKVLLVYQVTSRFEKFISHLYIQIPGAC